MRRLSGDTLSGRFVRASDAALVVDSGGRQLQIEAREIEAVDRHGSHLARGLLFGSAAGATLTATSALSSGASGGETVFAAAIGGISGIAWGALIGRIVPRHIPAYVAPPRAVRLAPILKPGQRGALFSVRY